MKFYSRFVKISRVGQKISKNFQKLTYLAKNFFLGGWYRLSTPLTPPPPWNHVWAYAQERKANGLTADYECLFISNCVNFATRMRIDILKALASKISNTRETAYVVSFTSKTTIQKKIKKGQIRSQDLTYTFVDAIKIFGMNQNLT